MEFEEVRVGTERVITAKVPDSEKWVPALLSEIDNNQSKFETSHKINNRWENSYLDIALVPTVRVPMRFARDLGVKILEIRSVILFESLNPVVNPFPPFWFNIARSEEFTGLHDHDSDSALSAVSYLQADPHSGNLYFAVDNKEDIEIEPRVGEIILFPPHLRHGVRPNQSTKERISLAFNLQSFPLIHKNL